MNFSKIDIEAIEYYLPNNYFDHEEISSKFGFDIDFVKNKIGVNKIFYADDHEYSSDLAASVLNKLIKNTPGLKEKLEIVIVCTQTPDTQLPQVSSVLQHKCSLSDKLVTFDINLGCSGFVYGVNILKSFMELNNLSYGVLITVETYSKIINPNDRNTKPLFSDAAAATLLSPNGKFKMGKSSFLTSGKDYNALITKKNELGFPEFYMDGRKVFNFVISNIPNEIYRVCDMNNINIDQIDYYVFHQASKFVLDSLSEKLKLNESVKVINQINKFGNTASSSIPITLKSISDILLNGKIILVSGFGIGLSASSSLLKIDGITSI
jgi:3-oxoacyl-[acyl-carrier-protein] synthase-3